MPATRQKRQDSLTFALSLGEQGAKSYRRLLRALSMARGRFHLFPVESTLSVPEREKLFSMLRSDLAEAGLCLRTAVLGVDRWDAPALIKRDPPVQENEVLVLLGLEDTPGIVREGGAEAIRPPALALLNQSRETLRALIHAPLIVWCPPYAYSALAEHAPDLFDQYTGVFDFSKQDAAKLETVKSVELAGVAVGVAVGSTEVAFAVPSRLASDAIELRRKALAAHPEQSWKYADALLSLAAVLCEQEGLARTDALLEARSYSLEAVSLLEYRTDHASRFSWAAANFQLGRILDGLPIGDKVTQTQEAIRRYEATLSVFTEQAFPQEWAMTQNYLGRAFYDLPTGDRDVNLKRAIAFLETTLRIFTEQAFPSNWAMTQNNLAAIYSQLPSGDRNANLRRAIAYCEAALRIFTEHSFPQHWAGVQNWLAFAYSYLPSGGHDANLKRAIACSEAALRILTEQAYPK